MANFVVVHGDYIFAALSKTVIWAEPYKNGLDYVVLVANDLYYSLHTDTLYFKEGATNSSLIVYDRPVGSHGRTNDYPEQTWIQQYLIENPDVDTKEFITNTMDQSLGNQLILPDRPGVGTLEFHIFDRWDRTEFRKFVTEKIIPESVYYGLFKDYRRVKAMERTEKELMKKGEVNA